MGTRQVAAAAGGRKGEGFGLGRDGVGGAQEGYAVTAETSQHGTERETE